jgi:hypothetical protein
MIQHISDWTLADWLGGEEDAAALDHMESCGACRKEAVDLRGKIETFRDALHAAGDARDFTWTPPAESVAERKPLWGQILNWSARAALVACVLALVLLMNSPRPQPPAVSTDAQDNALLENIQSDLSQQSPQALEPAETFLAEMTVKENSSGKIEQQGGKQ